MIQSNVSRECKDFNSSSCCFICSWGLSVLKADNLTEELIQEGSFTKHFLGRICARS